MTSDVFRFVTIRPPQQTDEGETANNVIDLGVSRSAFIDSLRELRVAGLRANIVAAAATVTASTDFIDSRRKLDTRLLDFASVAHQLLDPNFWRAAEQEFARVFGGTPAEFVTTDAYRNFTGQTTDSIVAATIDISIAPAVRTLLVRMARTLWLIRRLANSAPVTRRSFLNALVAVPEGIFPLPTAGVDLKAERKAQAEADKAVVEARRKHSAQLTANLLAYRQATDELLNSFDRTGGPSNATPTNRHIDPIGERGTGGFLLPQIAAESLSDATKTTLKEMGMDPMQIDIASSVALLEKKSATLASQLSTYSHTSQMVRIGNRIISADALLGGLVVADPGSLPSPSPLPGLCPPVVDTTPPVASVTVPEGHGEARVLGIAELQVVEQVLLRYQLGEIAHIENVIRGEVRSREFKITDTTQQSLFTETENITTKEQDLESSERFELQTESQTVINQNASKAAGIIIHASYGPSVDATASYNISSSTATQQSNASSSNYAREITNKAVDRVQTRTLTRRTVTTTKVVEETNRHAFDNAGKPDDIVGIYRYVDKVYSAQIVNYDKRLMLEFMVPEPAAFLRYALMNKPVENVSLVEPDPPGYCLSDGKTFVPLQVADLALDNYRQWVSKYGAQNVTPPPPSLIIASESKKAPDHMPAIGEALISSDTFDVTIPDGYHGMSAFVNLYGETQFLDPQDPVAPVHRIVFQLQKQQGVYAEPLDDNRLYYLELAPTPKLTVTINSLRFHNYEVVVTVLCERTPEKLHEWQLKTYASIMNAYNDLKSAYDEAIREARLQASDAAVMGTNPENNRVTEQIELKKGCISLLTGQRFDLFDAVTRNVAPYGYPEIDFAEAKAEGAYIQMFEQSFEWNNMVYLFYPYFWGKKDDWVTMAQLSDNDPLFARFLQAGAARVQVPVRPGFEDGIITYLATGERWTGEGTLVTSENGQIDPLHLSIVDEIKSQTNNNNIEGIGTLTLTKDSPRVMGDGTAFTEHDQNKRLVIGTTTYVIKKVQDAQSIVLTSPYSGESGDGLSYALGGKLVGQPWEVKLPTNLVKLDNSIPFS